MFENKSMTDWAKINLLRDMAVESFNIARHLILQADPKTLPAGYIRALNEIEAKFQEYNLDPNESRFTEIN